MKQNHPEHAQDFSRPHTDEEFAGRVRVARAEAGLPVFHNHPFLKSQPTMTIYLPYCPTCQRTISPDDMTDAKHCPLCETPLDWFAEDEFEKRGRLAGEKELKESNI